MKAALRSSDGVVIISICVSPGAKKSGIEAAYGENFLKMKVAAPPVDGRANTEVERFFAKLLGVRRSDVEVVRGTSSRAKTVLVRGVRFSEVARPLTEPP